MNFRCQGFRKFASLIVKMHVNKWALSWSEIRWCAAEKLFMHRTFPRRTGARRHGHLPSPPWKMCTMFWWMFWCIRNESKTLSRRIIYAKFSKHSSAFGGFIGAPFLDRVEGRKPQRPNLPWKILRAAMSMGNVTQ